MERITSKEDLKVYVEELGFLPLYKNVIPGFSVEELSVPGCFRSGDQSADPRCWKRDLSRDRDMAFGTFFNGKEGFVSRSWFPVFAAYRRKGVILDQQEEAWWPVLKMEILIRGYTSRKGCRKLLGPEKTAADSDRLLRHLQMGTFMIQEYEKKEIHYILPEQKWGSRYVGSGPGQKEKAWEHVENCIGRYFPDLTQKQILTVMAAGSDRRSVVRQRHAYPDNLLEKIFAPVDSAGPEDSRTAGQSSVDPDVFLKDYPLRAHREQLANEFLSEIPGREKEFLLLRFKDQMTIAKICEKTGLSDEYVRKRIRNGIRRIQRKK